MTDTTDGAPGTTADAGRPRRLAVLGSPIAHSKSPALHRAKPDSGTLIARRRTQTEEASGGRQPDRDRRRSICQFATMSSGPLSVTHREPAR